MTDDPSDPDLAEGEVDEKLTEPGPNVTAMNFWEEVVEDMTATAAEYRAEGWETLELHPGDVTVVTGEGSGRAGLDVLVPDDEFDELQSLLAEDVAFDSYQVYRAIQDEMAFVVVAMEDTDTRTAVLYPAYYDLADADTVEVMNQARREGKLHSYLRILKGEYVEMTHEDPSLFVPEENDADGDGDST